MAEENSPERRAELIARHRARRYDGAHIRKDVAHPPPSPYEVTPADPEVDVQALGLQVDALTDMLQKIVVGASGHKSQEDADVALPKPKFDGTVSWGNILVLLGFAVSAALGYANQQTTNQHFEEGLRQNAIEIARVRKEGEDRAAKYAPMIESNMRVNEAQSQMIASITESLRQIRDLVSDLAKAQAATDKALAVWIAQHQHGDSLPGSR